MVTNKLPQFKGKPLIEIPETVPRVNFLEGNFGEAVNEEVQGKYEGFDAISRVGTKGSNPFYCVAVNEVFRDQGLDLRTATQADLEKVLRTEALPLGGIYVDSGLALRNKGNHNEYFAKELMSQLRERNQDEMPVMIPLYGLELEKDGDSVYGLSFKLRDDAEIIHAPILNSGGGNYSSEDVDKDIGLPRQLNGGDRRLWTGNSDSGLYGVYLNRNGGLYSNVDGLAFSDDFGRVVVLDGKDTAQKKFDEEMKTNYQVAHGQRTLGA